MKKIPQLNRTTPKRQAATRLKNTIPSKPKKLGENVLPTTAYLEEMETGVNTNWNPSALYF